MRRKDVMMISILVFFCLCGSTHAEIGGGVGYSFLKPITVLFTAVQKVIRTLRQPKTGNAKVLKLLETYRDRFMSISELREKLKSKTKTKEKDNIKALEILLSERWVEEYGILYVRTY